jgi:hypothetical protein
MSVEMRFKQGIQAIFAFRHTIGDDQLADVLTPEQIAIFRLLPHVEQLHSVNVLNTARQSSSDIPHDLAVACLLHDVGKSRFPLALWQKSLAVILKRIIPQRFEAWSKGDHGDNWRQMFTVRENHPRWSVELVQHTDITERALWLILHHGHDLEQFANHPHYDLLRRLKQADDAN